MKVRARRYRQEPAPRTHRSLKYPKWKPCPKTGKRGYTRKAASFVAQHATVKLRPYRCHACERFHLTSK